ncbi:MAG: hypothetical protein M3258_05410 [Thermoproteota archaeon]|nr:hypothetical protein [Thermoproteota archaeon]
MTSSRSPFPTNKKDIAASDDKVMKRPMYGMALNIESKKHYRNYQQ